MAEGRYGLWLGRCGCLAGVDYGWSGVGRGWAGVAAGQVWTVVGQVWPQAGFAIFSSAQQPELTPRLRMES